MNEKVKKWLKAAGVRAVKTFAQTFASFITVGLAFSQIDWRYAISCAAVAGVYSVAMSFAGLPELKNGEQSDKSSQT